MYYAYALARIGEIEKAEEILCGKDGKTYMVVPDTVCDQFTLRDALKHGPWILCDQNGVMYHEETL